MKNVNTTSVELLLCNARGVLAPQSITLSSEMIDNEEKLAAKAISESKSNIAPWRE